LPPVHRAVIEALETRLLLSIGLLTTDQDIGSPSRAGSASSSNGSYTVIAGGTGIGGLSDQFNFAYEAYSGNATLVTQVSSLTNTSASAQAGLMIRNDTSAVSAFVGAFVTPTSGIELVTRTADGGTAGQTTLAGTLAPEYLELSLAGSTVTAYYSSDGVTWSQLGSSQTITLGSSPLIGLAAASANNSLTTTASFSKLDILPSGWSDNDIGSPPLPGSAGYNVASNTFTVLASGSGVGGASDQFNFLNYAVTGNGSVSALVDSLTNTNPSAAAGVMIRSDTTAGSLVAEVDLTAQNTVVFAGRSSGGAFTSTPVTVSGPVWLDVTDAGGNFIGYYSSNDVNWTQIGTTEAIAMPNATTLGGLWASSNSGSALNTAVFSGVSLTRGGWTDTDIGSPAITGSADYDAPSDTTTISGNGADIWGTSDQFNFNSTTMTGDGSAIAYVNSITNTNAWAKAGVMIRNDTTAGSAFAAVLVSPTSGITFEWRSTAGGVTNQEISSPAGGPTPAPVGLKLTRSGNTFTAYYSTDGINWLQVGPSQSVALNSTVLAGIAVTSHNTGELCTATFSSVSIGNNPPPGAGIYSSADQLFLNNLEDSELMYYWNETNSSTGLVPDYANANGGGPSADSSIAAVGFGLTALTIGDARGWLSHASAYQRALNTIDFLYNSGANVNGFFYHFLNETTGARYGTSEVSSVDTAELMAGVLSAAQYWAGTPLQTTALALFNRVDWPWMQEASGVFYGAWTPESGFSGGYGDFSEAALLYLLGLGSPTYPTSVASWYSWSRTPVETYSGYTFVEADDAALFTEQYPQDWFDLQGLTDAKGLNFYQNSQTATLAQRQFMINLNSTYSDYSANLWGLTPSEGVSGYTVWGGPPADGPINGTVVPAAAGGSLEFEPRLTIDVLENMKQTYPSEYQKYGLVDAFNPLTSWSSSLVLGIDLGPTLIAAENSRSNLVWNGFMQTSAAQQAVAKAFPTTTPVWAVNGSGNFNVAANWTTGAIPNGIGATAEFLDVTPPAQTVYTNAAITEGTLHFNSANEYELTGTGSLTLQASGSNSALVEVDQGTVILDLPTTLASNTTFNVAAGATLVIGNPLTINSGVTLTQTGGGVVTYESTINVVGDGSLVLADSTYADALSLAPGATASLTGNGTVLELGSLSNSGTINLQNNVLLIDYAGSSDPIASIRAELTSGYAGGTWTGPGIMSTAAQNNSAHYGIGYADSADPGNPAGLAPGTIKIMYTLLGDANLDGLVNGSDFNILAANFNQSVTGWDQGDFNYDGLVNAADFNDLAANFGQQSDAAPAVIPASGTGVVVALSLKATGTPTVTSVAAATPPTISNAADANLLNQNQSDSVSAGVLNPEEKDGHKLRQSNHHPRV
jgi:hypothetical protein